MPDLLVKLYELPDVKPLIDKLHEESISVREALAYEKHQVVEWVKGTFSQGWASECDVAFSNKPISCFIATKNTSIVGFACYNCTCKNFFGPMGIAEQDRNRGIGKALLFSCLSAMAASGYAYAIIGGANSVDFYKKTVGATEIPGSSPGIYRDRLE